MEHLSNNHKDCPNQHQNSHELCDETGHPVVNLMESQWKLRQQHDQNFGKFIRGKVIGEINKERNPKEQKSDRLHKKCSIELWTILLFELLLIQQRSAWNEHSINC